MVLSGPSHKFCQLRATLKFRRLTKESQYKEDLMQQQCWLDLLELEEMFQRIFEKQSAALAMEEISSLKD